MSKSSKSIFISNIRSQQGVALILFFLVILLTGAIFFVSQVSMDDKRIENEEKTTQALAKAKAALIAFSTTFHDTASGGDEPRAGLMGFLPCPERASSPSEGQSPNNCFAQYQSFLGRVPWKDLGIEPLKDGSGNCLWYAVSGEYKNGAEGVYDAAQLPAPSGLARTDMLNEDSNGSFELFNRNGVMIKGNTADDRPVAVIIAPGRALQGQNRVFDNTTHCGGDFVTDHFMENFNGIDNRSITQAEDFIDQFIASDRGNDDTFNDRIITISKQEIFDAIRKRSDFNNLMENTTRELAKCVAEFGKSNPMVSGCNDLNGCRRQCRRDRDSCNRQCDSDRRPCTRQCDTDRGTCRTQCSADEAACRAAGGSRNACRAARRVCDRSCNRDRTSCRRVCNTTRNNCRTGCNATRTSCNANCVATCTSGGGGGGGSNDFRLPWPAPMVFTDYRDSQLYIEDKASGNHLGRIPVEISSSVGDTGNIYSGTYLFESDFRGADATYTHCRALNTDFEGTNPDNYNSVERRIWQNWKDHFFYAVANEFNTNATTPTPDPCPGCLSINGAGNFAAIVFFSGERLSGLGQVRTVLPNDADTKQNIANYLEGNNAANYLGAENANGDGDYQTGPASAIFNDIAYCINANMDVNPCPTPP